MLEFLNEVALGLILLMIPFCQPHISKDQCGPAFGGRCVCGRIDQTDSSSFLVNCTNTGFTNTSMLEHLPRETETLIFNGNDIPVLPWNVFGNEDNTPFLRVVDMSNNRIREIRGKAYHHVASVEILILNHNELSLSLNSGLEDHRHPRMFSNFINLKALHLTNAFKDNSSVNLVNDLHDIFINSNLSQLIKLHLEQNELTGFVDQMVFCDLPALMDLHLGDNLLRGLHFNLTCLRQLRFLDLQRNRIGRLSKSDLTMLDSFPARGQQLTIDVYGNPFCDCSALHNWLKTTKVTVRKEEFLKCDGQVDLLDSNSRDEVLHNVLCTSLHNPTDQTLPQHGIGNGAAFVIALLTVAVVGLSISLLYMKRTHLRHRLTPLLDTVSRKVHYTTIHHQGEEEVDL